MKYLIPFLFLQNSLLWQIDGKGYLFGTMHQVCENQYLWTQAMDSSLSRSNVLYLEFDITDPSNSMQVAQGLYNTTGKPLQSYFTPTDWQSISHYVTDSLNLALPLIQQFTPSALYVILQGNNHCVTVSYEDRIAAKAIQAKKPIRGLETVQSQIKLLNSVPVDTVIVRISEMVKAGFAQDSGYNALADLYRAQNVTGLYLSILNNARPPIEPETYINKRNRDWLPEIERALVNDRPFIAVGAGHVYGLIWLLRSRGHVVTPVR